MSLELEKEPDDVRSLHETGGFVVGDRFKIIDRLRSGKHSVVYSAIDQKAEQSETALKFYLNEGVLSEKLHNTAEMELCEQIDHPNIIHSLGRGAINLADNKYRYMASRLASEGTFKNFKLGFGSEDSDVLLLQKYVSDAAEGLEELHKHGLVHRDLRPANIFIDKDEKGETRAIIGDLGMVAPFDEKRIDNEGLTKTLGEARRAEQGTSPGIRDYSAPEQELFGESQPESDVYSLGRVATSVLNGGHIEPGYAYDGLNVYSRIPPENITVVAENRYSIPKRFADLIKTSQRIDPDSRPSAHDFAEITS